MEGKFIIIIAVALFFIALVQLMKIYDLAAKVRLSLIHIDAADETSTV